MSKFYLCIIIRAQESRLDQATQIKINPLNQKTMTKETQLPELVKKIFQAVIHVQTTIIDLLSRSVAQTCINHWTTVNTKVLISPESTLLMILTKNLKIIIKENIK